MAQCSRCGRQLPALSFGKKICVWCKQHEAAQRGEATEYQPVMAAPWTRTDRSMPMLVTQAILGISVAVFLGMALSSGSPMGFSGDLRIAWGANYGVYTFTGQWWRLITYGFLHGDLLHIALNMWCLWSLGEMAERLYGRLTFAAVYLLCIVGGGLGSAIWNAGAPVASVGASGAVFGLAGALIASLKLGEFAMPALSQSTMQSLIAFVGYNVVFGFIASGIDNACHFGGLITGLILGALIARLSPQARPLPRLGILLGVACLLALIGWQAERRLAPQYLGLRIVDELNEGHLEQVRALGSQVVAANASRGARLYEKIAVEEWKKGDLAAAQRDLTTAIQSSPEDTTLYYRMGQVLIDAHQFDLARQNFRKVLALEPKSWDGHYGLGMVAMAEGNYSAALAEYDGILQADPSAESVQEQRGKCLMALQRYDEAIAAFQKEIAISGGERDTQQQLAAAYEAKGMKAEAEAARKIANTMPQE